jgi:acetolactate synthase-1/2/3 large subunit
MKTDVKSAIADILRLEGIEYVFGYTGGHIMQMWEAANNAGIKTILNKQEGNGVYMADAFARIIGKPGIILGTAGPGVTNMTTGLATSFLDSIPLIAIGAGVATSAFGKNAVQDGSGRGRATEQRAAMKSVCKQAMLAPTPQAVPDMIREAFREALSGRPGPVYVEVPSDFWDIPIEYEKIQPSNYRNCSLTSCNINDSTSVQKKLLASKHPLIVIGEGANEPAIGAKMMKFIEKVFIPFTVSPLGKNVVDEFHPLYLGVMRMQGTTQKVYEYIKKSDFILFLGDRMQEWEVAWYNKELFSKATLAQVDPDWNEIGRVYPVDFSAVGSITSFIDTEGFKKHNNAQLLQEKVKQLWKQYPIQGILKDSKGINPLNINTLVQKHADKDATIVTDTGYAKSMAIIKYLTHLNQHFISADKNGPMGYSVPAALGAALATNKQVIAFVGDGGFQMSLNELGTAMNYGLKAIYIILNNGGCSSIVNYHKSVYGHHCADTFKNPDFVALAQSYGMKGYKVTTTEDFEKAFLLATKSKTSVLIDAHVNQASMIWE